MSGIKYNLPPPEPLSQPKHELVPIDSTWPDENPWDEFVDSIEAEIDLRRQMRHQPQGTGYRGLPPTEVIDARFVDSSRPAIVGAASREAEKAMERQDRAKRSLRKAMIGNTVGVAMMSVLTWWIIRTDTPLWLALLILVPFWLSGAWNIIGQIQVGRMYRKTYGEWP